jgi:hypothetical protein
MRKECDILMKIKDGIKAGIGFTIGMSLTCGAIKFVSEKLMNKMANDKEYMEKLKTEDPAGYETLQKFIKHD